MSSEYTNLNKPSGSSTLGDEPTESKKETSELRRYEDREAKRRARGSGTSKRDSGESKERASKRRDSDDKSTKSGSRRKGALTPGATYERSSERSSGSPRDSKRKEKRRPRERTTKPGARPERSSESRDAKRKEPRARRSRPGALEPDDSTTVGARNTRKERRSEKNGNPDEDVTERSVLSSSLAASGTVDLTASLVNDDSDEKIKKLEEMNARMQQQMEQIKGTTNENEASTKDSTAEKEKAQTEPAPKKKWMFLAAFLVVVVGVGAFFGTRSSSSSGGEGTAGIADIADIDPSSPPVGNIPSGSPTEQDVAFGPPSPEDCESIAQQQPLSGQESLPNQTYFVDLDVDPMSTFSVGSVFAGYIEEAVQSEIVSELVGCKVSARKLIRSQTMPRPSRHLDNELEYIIRNVAVDSVVGGSCEDGSDASCKRIIVTLVVKLSGGGVRSLDVVSRIDGSFNTETSLVDKLGLRAVSTGIRFIALRSDAIANPSKVPSPRPTSDPPSAPVLEPTLAPVAGPTPPPTSRPTSSPVVGPSPPPIPAPTPEPTRSPTLRPTLAPAVGPSPPPTPEPTPEPTPSPTLRPTLAPV
ncbi:MAG: hypothetical protein SGBAC_012693, partial [Bacillariaceae sp.]